jgi:uncharacterized membrane protein (DUF106 family)
MTRVRFCGPGGKMPPDTAGRMPAATSIFERNARLLVKTSKFMTLSLGKLLYPRLSPDQRRKEMHFLLGALLTGLITACIIVLEMIVMGEKHLR